MRDTSTISTLEEIGRLLALLTNEIERKGGDNTSTLTLAITAHKLTLTERAKLGAVVTNARLMAAPMLTETMQ